MVSEPLFSMYFAGESEAVELLDEPQEVKVKDERIRRMKRKRFIETGL